MRSASADGSRPRALALPGGWPPAAALTLLLTLLIANSTVQADWVRDSGRITPVALVAALAVGGLGLLRRVPWPAGLAVLLAGGPVSGWVAARTDLPALPGTGLGGLGALPAWSARVASGAAFADPAVLLLLLAGLLWLGAGWLAWSVLRWRQPLLGMLPLGLLLATNVLNSAQDQNGPVLGFLLLCCGLLLWSSYLRSVEGAAQRGLRLAADVRWSFWELGVTASVAVLLLGLFVPPLSTTDRTVSIQSGLFRGWAHLQQGLDHPVPFGPGSGEVTSQGFSQDVALGGPLHRTGDVVLTYGTTGDLPGPYYFRGVDLASTRNGEWRWTGASARPFSLPGNAGVPWAEQYQDERAGVVKVQVVRPPAAAGRVLFYPGALQRVDEPVRAQVAAGGVLPAEPSGRGGLPTVDRVEASADPGRYTATVAVSAATDAALRRAGTGYPEWVEAYRNFLGGSDVAPGSWNPPDASSAAGGGQASYRSPQTLSRIHDLAVQVTAGVTNPYDAATAIETHLRTQYKYTLKPSQPPRGQDPLGYFLFQSQEGYCEYFASAMGDMLRSLGIPVRLVNGFGPGTYDQKRGRFLVRESDAHTWPEVYFPGFGWIPFEPTPDGTSFPIPRGTTGASCGENGACGAASAPGSATGQQVPLAPGAAAGELPGGGGGGPSHPTPFPWPPVVAALAAVFAVAFLVVSRWLRPRRIQSIWRRSGVLARLAGVPPHGSDTPFEFGERLARALPPAAEPARELARQVTLAAYAPIGTAGGSRDAAAEAWAQLRGRLLRRLLDRAVRLGRRRA